MRMASLTLDEFMVAVKGVNATLSSEEHYAALLNEASSDTPVIDELLEQLAILEAFPESKQKSIGLTAAHRDLVILLALRHVEKAESAAVN